MSPQFGRGVVTTHRKPNAEHAAMNSLELHSKSVFSLELNLGGILRELIETQFSAENPFTIQF